MKYKIIILVFLFVAVAWVNCDNNLFYGVVYRGRTHNLRGI